MNYEQSNVGTGMVPCKKGCRCDDCTIERLNNELRQARAEIERLGARCLKLYKANEKQYKTIMHDLEAANKQEPDDD